MSINEEKVFDKIEHSFMIKTLRKTRIEENFKLIKSTYKIPKVNIQFNG